VVALFGLPDHPPGYLRAAVDCAAALSDIGRSVMLEWQRQIDRAQAEAGVHSGIALGEVQVTSLRPFGQAHLGAIGDSINLAARLAGAARTGEVVVSNTLFRKLDERDRPGFRELEPLEAKNVGRIRAWVRSFAPSP
jgi:class 3 adenylate cyclase